MFELLRPLIDEFPSRRRWVIAYSGGLDSRVLLDLCVRLRDGEAHAPAVVALHVDHRVHPDSAAWAAHCRDTCASLGVPLHVHALAASPSPSARAHSEGELRAGRYRAFEAFCGADDLLLLAHHRDDQAETVLLRLARGAGIDGLAGMPRVRPCGAALLCRPLLAVDRAALRAHADAAGLAWVEDPGNASPDYARNFLRRDILPALEARWHGVAGRIARAAAHCGEAAMLAAECAASDIAACEAIDAFGLRCLPLDAVRALSAPRARNLLRAWVGGLAGATLDTRALATLESDVIAARDDAAPALCVGAAAVRRHRDRLYVDLLAAAGSVPERIVVAADFAQRVDGVGHVELCRAPAGIRAGSHMELRFRDAGTRCRLAGRPCKTLKKLLQEHDVPPWLRGRLPLLHVDGELAAIASIGVCEGHVAAPGEDALALHWTPA